MSKTDEDGFVRVRNKIWIPEDADELKLKLLTVAHARNAGHLGADATYASLLEEFTWRSIQTDAKDFVSNCMLCVAGLKFPDHSPLPSTDQGLMRCYT